MYFIYEAQAVRLFSFFLASVRSASSFLPLFFSNFPAKLLQTFFAKANFYFLFRAFLY